ncbi:acetyl-CoA carboxylase carboxyltransferase subunit alpha [Sneathiella chinensis]|uniref:Acetyl-coenzyme A carboxylase carboxyl transferase subunit alpha n=1 Tax=Sneathiella chinensis TaxID=349750 RepID=A0ABQ5U2J0_9PROT|nr:acetyl-CoA carboxylase carboxyltransferase subunit alpha [Sneathiella chinensis]GLQ05631.1 acetyl-coenzyme A carboxylase carboxyl transferase subunit alpha [Sneathiella chinensis]
MSTFLDFEKSIADLEGKIRGLEGLEETGDLEIQEDVNKLRQKSDQLIRSIYSKLTPWQKTQVARHVDRPKLCEITDRLIEDFIPLAGDRLFGEDHAIVGGMGRFRGRTVMVIGTEKGNDIESRLRHNFGMARPEGYRKAQRLMKMADQFGIPVLTFVDTSGAYPGIGAEERGQAEAIARSIQVSMDLRVPVIAAIVGEGGSGGAVAIATANRVIMFENAIYSVISPEGCAAILWKTREKAQDAATAMKLTAQDLKELGVIDTIVEEPLGGAHRNVRAAIDALGDAVEAELESLAGKEPGELREDRRNKFLAMGRVNGLS